MVMVPITTPSVAMPITGLCAWDRKGASDNRGGSKCNGGKCFHDLSLGRFGGFFVGVNQGANFKGVGEFHKSLAAALGQTVLHVRTAGLGRNSLAFSISIYFEPDH